MKTSFEALQQIHNRRKTHISQYDTAWVSKFTKESAKLFTVFNNTAIKIQHIGSTAIPGIKAKPIIDILITTKDINLIDKFDPDMEKLGYLIGGEFGLSGRRFYCKGDNLHCNFHVHVYEAEHPAVEMYLLFRDYLIKHPNEAKAYETLKTDLAAKFPNNRTLYTQSKGQFIKEIHEKAAAWRKKG